MLPLSRDVWKTRESEYDRDVLRTPGIDFFCSSTDWLVPAHDALMPPRTLRLFHDERGWLMFAEGPLDGFRRALQPLEAAWALGSPLIGPEPRPLVDALDSVSAEQRWSLVLVSGVVEGSPLFHDLLQVFGRRGCRLFRGPETQRYEASLVGGVDGFLSRRSRNFRKGLRRAQRHAQDQGLVFQDCTPVEHVSPSTLYERVLAVEARSWKGRTGVGITDGRMRDFYAQMVQRLSDKGALWLSFARHRDTDVGYIMGTVLGNTYRGLQFSFDTGYTELSLGNLLQMHHIEQLCAARIENYDLGSDASYKSRWAEGGLTTVTVVIER